MQKRTFVFLAVVLGGIAAISIPLGVLAEEATNTDNFVSILASKLGLQTEVVEAAVFETKSEIRTTKDQEQKTEIDAAVTNGLLTQRQGDLLKALIDNRPEAKPDFDFSDSSKTRGQVMAESEVTILNNVGLNTTVQEVQETKEAAREAGIEKGGLRRERGMDKMM